MLVSRPFMRSRPGVVFRLSIRRRSAHDFAMSNQAPVHTVEIVFYAAASCLAMAGLMWFLLR
jgi:hypothetical protein